MPVSEDPKADTSATVERLAQHRTLGEAPRAEHEWLVAHGTMYHLEPGPLHMADMLDQLVVLLSGHFSIYVDHGAGRHRVMEWHGGDVSGILPYSRMSRSIGEMFIEEPGDALLVHKRHFPELIRECPCVTSSLVHVMIDRARVFRGSEAQDEKLKSLGRIAAGLAHELNNPAAAIARSATLLADGLAEAEQTARELGAARLTDAQLDAIDRARLVCVTMPAATLTPLERGDREEEIVGWLEAHAADAAIAPALADTAVTVETLDGLAATLDRSVLSAALRWVAAGCSTRALAADIQRAAARISHLVVAVKNFAYVDRAPVPAPLDVAASINDSVVLLQHKARKRSAGIDVSIAPGLPPVLVIPGDIGQVWMNLIDNALDALPDSGGHVSISAERRMDRVVVRIVDNGAGIPDNIRDQIFNPFFTSKPVGQGTGLGLDIALRFVRSSNGDIEFDSRPGRTEFRVILPVASVPSAAVQTAAN